MITGTSMRRSEETARDSNPRRPQNRGVRMTTRFGHVNIIARDWVGLAAFYRDAFGCEPCPPERAWAGAWLDRATGIPGARIRGMHLRLPGFGDGGPTLEIFQYGFPGPVPKASSGRIPRPDAPGLGHLAFAVDSLEATVERILALGGGTVGEAADVLIPGLPPLRFRYIMDPEGNLVEIQEWGETTGSLGLDQ